MKFTNGGIRSFIVAVFNSQDLVLWPRETQANIYEHKHSTASTRTKIIEEKFTELPFDIYGVLEMLKDNVKGQHETDTINRVI